MVRPSFRIGFPFQYGSRVGTKHVMGARRLDEVDAAVMRHLLLHEARVHAMPSREVRDLGDAILLHDPQDPEPFWNRVESIRWPTDPGGFDRRLAETLVLFATLTRQPHIWPSPVHDQPVDLVDRLVSHGFRDMGAGGVMLLTDPGPALADRVTTSGVSLERLHDLGGTARLAAAQAIVPVLSDAFDVDDARRVGVTTETLASLANSAFTHYLVRIDGEPAAVARRATFDGASYLSSIGTMRWARGRGLGRLVTTAAAADALEAGSAWIYLGVFAENDTAIRLYRRSGFEMIGAPVPDLLFIG